MSFLCFGFLFSKSFLFLRGVYLLISLMLFCFVMALVKFLLGLVGAPLLFLFSLWVVC